jgi:FlaA1/EpsC-like NDP-sugar epimerase
MIRLSGFQPDNEIEIVFTGLRPGEKLFEELLSHSENTLPTHHPRIMIAKVSPVSLELVKTNLDVLKESWNTNDNFKIVAQLKKIAPDFRSNNSIYESLDLPQQFISLQTQAPE